MLRPLVSRLMAVSVLFVLTITPSAVAGMRSRVEPGVFAPLGAPIRDGVSLRISKLPLVESNETIILEEFDVLAPGAVIEVFDGDMKPHRVKPQPMRQFHGTVSGDPTSVVYLSITRGTRLDGIIISRNRKFSIWSTSAGRPVPREKTESTTDIFIEEITNNPEIDAAQSGFMCDVEKMKVGEIPQGLPRSLAASELNVRPNAAPTGTQKTVLNLAIQTDSALHTNFSSNPANIETFARNLIGAASTIYSRDLNTEIRIPYLGVFTTTDPFTANGTDTFAALAEIGDYWHFTPPSAAPRSAAALLSGQSTLAGVAWVGTTCTSDFLCTGGGCGSATFDGHYGGGYSYNGGMGLNTADRTVPNPDANPNFGTPSSGYWPLFQISHEFGHNVQSGHTHCITLSPADQATYGRTHVDNCYTGECYSGATSLPADGAGGRGTLMSYCHLLPGLGNNTRYTFGQANEASHQVVDNMKTRLNTITPAGLSAITAPASVPPGVGGQAASVSNTAGLTFDWTISNGTFTGGGTTATGASVTFTGVTNPVTLKVYATNTSGCAITDSKSVTVAAVSVNPPTNVLATATSGTTVSVTWTNASGATSYNVYRSTNNSTYTKISTDGAVTTTPFTDSTASANTAYMYKVRSVQSAVESADSNKDFTVAMSYTDPTITAASTTVKAIHFTQLRTAVNALRTLNAGQGAFSFTDGTLNTTIAVKGVHLTQLRTELNTVRTALGFSTVTFTTDPTITATTTTVKKAHVDQMRAGVQ